MKKLFFFAIIFFFSASSAFAARPLVNDDCGTVAFGKYELEVGYNLIGKATTGFVSQIKKGLSQNIDLGLEIPYNTSAVSGLADLVLHAKLRIKEFGEGEGVTARGDIKLTSGDAAKGLGSGFLDYGLIMILSKKIAGMTGHLNFGYTVIGDAAGSAADDTFAYGVAVEKYFENGIGLGAEYVGSYCQVRSTANLQFCARYRASDFIRFDAGYSIGTRNSSNNITTAGLTCAF